MLFAGILDSLVRPPAAPINLAAMFEPTMAERFGAMKAIRDSTYSKILAFFSARSMAISQEEVTMSSSSLVRFLPWVVEAVTDTTMMVAWVRYCAIVSLLLTLSSWLPSSLAVIRYSSGWITKLSNSGNLLV